MEDFKVGDKVVSLIEINDDYGRVMQGKQGVVLGFTASGRVIFRFPGCGVHSFDDPDRYVVLAESSFSPREAKKLQEGRLQLLQNVVVVALDNGLSTSERIRAIKLMLAGD